MLLEAWCKAGVLARACRPCFQVIAAVAVGQRVKYLAGYAMKGQWVT